MVNKKVGIITHYYNNKNYGGNLQAYALAKFIGDLGCNVEQISFSMSLLNPPQESTLSKIKKVGIIELFKKINNKIKGFVVNKYTKIKYKKFNKDVQVRYKAIDNFNKQLIPHSKEIYDDNNIDNCTNYDVYITGSDQVWNFTWYHPAFFLDFVGKEKTKISYSASMAMDSLDEIQKEKLVKSLATYKAISVREKKSKELIENNIDKHVEITIDPTLLLDNSDWDKICSDRLIKEKYIFCYFLNKKKSSRECARKYAKKYGYRIVNIPFLAGYNSSDKIISDIDMFDVSPEKFISLIKYAECIFTDSFHATVFSNIYKRQYFVFSKDNKNTMSSRIYTLLELFGTKNHFCDNISKENLNYLETVSKIDYTKENNELNLLIKKSKQFLIDNLG